MSPIVSSDFDNTSFTGSVCDIFRQKLLNNDKMVELLAYMFNDDGTIGPDFATDLLELMQPIGTFARAPVDLGLDPDVWLKAEGQNVSRTTYARLFAKYGTTFGVGDTTTTFGLPDLRDKFLVGASGTRPPGSTGGEETVALTEDELPEHRHELGEDVEVRWGTDNDPVSGGGNEAFDNLNPLVAGENLIGGFTEVTGAGDAHNNMPPYVSAVVYIKANHKIAGNIL